MGWFVRWANGGRRTLGKRQGKEQQRQSARRRRQHISTLISFGIAAAGRMSKSSLERMRAAPPSQPKGIVAPVHSPARPPWAPSLRANSSDRPNQVGRKVFAPRLGITTTNQTTNTRRWLTGALPCRPRRMRKQSFRIPPLPALAAGWNGMERIEDAFLALFWFWLFWLPRQVSG